MSRIALFGATGRTGTRLLAAALAAGHTVRALVRDPSRLPSRVGLEVMAGDVLNLMDVASVVQGTDGVLATLGGGTTADPGTSRSQGMRNIIAAMERHGVSRIVGLGGAGVLDAANGQGLRSEQPGYPAVFKRVSAEHVAACAALQATSLDWTYVGPPDIPDGQATGSYRISANVFPDKGKALSTGDLAAFMLEEFSARRFVRQRVGIAT